MIITGRPSGSSVICRLRPLGEGAFAGTDPAAEMVTDVADHPGPAPPPEEAANRLPRGKSSRRVRMGVRVLGAIRLTSPSGFRDWPSP